MSQDLDKNLKMQCSVNYKLPAGYSEAKFVIMIFMNNDDSRSHHFKGIIMTKNNLCIISISLFIMVGQFLKHKS